MIRHWADLLTNREQLDRYYSTIPSLDGAALRSLHLDRYGPALTLRLDLPTFPDQPDEKWVAAGCDEFQCQIRFLDTAELRVVGWPFSTPVDVSISPQEPAEKRRIAVTAVSARDRKASVRFTSSESLTIGHITASRNGDEAYWHAGRVDQIRLGTRLPDVTDNAYYQGF